MRRSYPESTVSGFSHVDGTVAFFTQIAAVLRPDDVVLDFGAGRGEYIVDDDNRYRSGLANLRGRCARLEGCDVDDAVVHNPFVDHAEVIEPGRRLPYSDQQFDIIFTRYVFEHIDDPHFVVGELLRVLKPGGLLAAVTPNKFGYIAVFARLMPNRLHVRMLTAIQPWRKAEDVFPTRYRLNTTAALRKAFGQWADVSVTYWSPEPAYHFGNRFIYAAIKFMNKHLPSWMQPTLHIYIRKL